MAFSGSGLTAIPPARLLDGKTGRFLVTAPRLHISQIRCKGNSDLEAPVKLTFSRRDAIISLTTLASAAISVSSPNTADARISKGEMRRKIKEKLELLREKAGVAKQKESDKEKSPSAKEENNLQLEPASLLDRSLVEAAKGGYARNDEAKSTISSRNPDFS